MAAAAPSDADALHPVPHEDHPTAAALPLSEWAIHHGEGERAPPVASAPPQQLPQQLPASYPASVQPYQTPAGEPYYPSLPGPPAPAPGAPPYLYPAGGAAMPQTYPDMQPGQQPPFPQLTAPQAYQQPYPLPYPQLPPPPDPAAFSSLQASGPRLEPATVNAWTVGALALNAAFVAAIACAALNLYSRRTELGVAAGVLYLMYLAVCLGSPSATALRNHMGALELLAHTQAVRMQRPEVWVSIVCYHFEQRTRQVMSTRNGKTKMRTEHYTEKVVTHSARAAWRYRWFRDTSGPPVYHPELPMIEIHFKPVQDFADSASSAAFQAWRAAFLEANTRDQRQDVSDGMDIEGLRPFVMLQQGTSWVVGPGAHALAVLAGVGIFYECAVFQRTPHAKYCALALSLPRALLELRL